MTAYFKVSGVLDVDSSRRGFQKSLAHLREVIGYASESQVIEFDEAGQQISIDQNTDMGYGRMEEIPKAITKFALRFITKPGRIYTQYEDDAEEVLYVGPPGFDELACQIEDAEAELKAAQEKLAELKAQRAART